MLHNARALGVEIGAEQAKKLVAYAQLIEKWNKGMNLVSRGDVVRLDSRHLLDSMAAIPHVQGKALLDVGTGPGLPGIPLAIAQPEVAITLWERMARRVRFLQMACRELGLKNVTIRECDIEKAIRTPESPAYDTIVARAVAPLEMLWPMLRDHLRADGRLIVYSHVAKPNDLQRKGEAAQERVERGTQFVDLKEVVYSVPGLAHEHYLQLMSKASGCS